MIPVGQQAPEFTSIDAHGQPIRLSDFRGRKIVLWFFPKADTPG